MAKLAKKNKSEEIFEKVEKEEIFEEISHLTIEKEEESKNVTTGVFVLANVGFWAILNINGNNVRVDWNDNFKNLKTGDIVNI